MTLLSVVLVILSALFHAVRNMFTKESSDKQIFLWWYSVFGTIFFSPVFFYVLYHEGMPDIDAWLWGIGSGFVHFIYWIFHTKAYEKGDLSRVYPIMRSSPALVLVFAVLFLGERVSLPGVAGILLVAAGVYIINMKHLSPGELIAPVRSILFDRSTRFAFLTLLSVALYSVVDKVAVSHVHAILFQVLHLLGGMLFLTPYLLAVKEKSLWMRVWSKNRRTILANGLLGVYGYMLILIAFTMEKGSYIVGLRQLSIVFAVILGGTLLKEKSRNIRLFAGIVIFTGAFLISMAG